MRRRSPGCAQPLLCPILATLGSHLERTMAESSDTFSTVKRLFLSSLVRLPALQLPASWVPFLCPMLV